MFQKEQHVMHFCVNPKKMVYLLRSSVTMHIFQNIGYKICITKIPYIPPETTWKYLLKYVLYMVVTYLV